MPLTPCYHDGVTILRTFSVLIFVAACTAGLETTTGEDDGNSNDSDGLVGTEFSCQAVSWCTNWQPERLGVLMEDLPSQPSGVLNDGLYRLEQGGFSALTYLFSEGRYIEISPNYNNVSGTFEFSGNRITLRANKTCTDDGEFDLASEQEKGFLANGDEFYFLGSCEAECTPSQRFVRVNDICSASANFTCDEGDDCVCDVQEDTIPTSNGELSCGTL